MLATPELISESGQPQRLAEVLPRYLAEVPLYRQRGGAAADGAPFVTPESLRRLPFITKQDIRRGFPVNFLGEETALEELLEAEAVELEHTSGTSEERTALLLPRGWWAEQERRALRLNALAARLLDLDLEARRTTINSPVCSGDICYTGVPSRDERIVGNSLFVSLSRYPFLWSEADLARMAAETVAWQPRFLDVDPVYGAVFALYCERAGIRLPSLQFIVCSYEFVSVVHRRILQRVFGVPVFDLYGSTETGHLLMETEPGQMRAAHETAFLEVVETDEQGIGELVVTTLTNPLMPLVRYRIGDLVEQHQRPYQTRYRLHGRMADAFTTPGGRRVTSRQVDQCFKDLDGFAHYQLVERGGGQWLLRFVAERLGPSDKALASVKERLSGLLEASDGLVIQPTDLLVPETSGKFRLGYPQLTARSVG
jgi:phenylacetate-CoA ligase